MTARTDSDRISELRKELAPVIDWYTRILAEGEPDLSYLYDSTVDQFEQLHHGIYQLIIEALLPDDVVRAPTRSGDDE